MRHCSHIFVGWLFLVAFLLYESPALKAQLITQGGFTAEHLVKNILLGGGVEAFNFNVQGAQMAYGTFDGSNTNIGIKQGIIMTTGSISGPEGPQGPNNKPNAGLDNLAPGSNLINLAFGFSAPSFNATVLSFDFIPQGDSIGFRYVFGSEEYKEFVGSEFNDAFGFFISGPNPAGGVFINKNIALIPGTNTPVAINNVNHLLNAQYYVDNETPPGFTIQYDGFTKPLLAWSKVVPCEVYTIRMIVADLSDPIYDSGVFLEAKSFSSRGYEMDYTIENSPSADSLFSNCGQARIVIRSTGDNSIPRTVNVSLQGNSINGVDYTNIPLTFSLAVGQDSVVFYTQGLFNPAETNPKSLIIQLNDPDLCPNVTLPAITIPIIPLSPIVVTPMSPLSFPCNNQVVSLNTTASGGLPPYNYLWNPGNFQGNSVDAMVTETTTFVVNVSDRCNNNASGSVTITVPKSDLFIVGTPDANLCPGDSLILSIQVGGGVGNAIVSWSNGHQGLSPQVVSPDISTVYGVIVTDSCGNMATVSTIVRVSKPEADFTFKYIANATLVFTPEFIDDVNAWEWHFGDGNVSFLHSPTHSYSDTGTYVVSLIVLNSSGCSDTIQKQIIAYPPFRFYIPNAFTPNEDGLNDIFKGMGEGFSGFEMWIFDRWGQNLFTSKDFQRGWNGIDASGKRYPLGVYAYTFILETPVGSVFEYRGKVTLIR
jgi:gliding motility-associated-like protein